MFRRILIFGILIACSRQSVAQATRPGDDAAALYLQAAKIIDDNRIRSDILSPSESLSVIPQFPPFPAEWNRIEKTNYAANASARALVHNARLMQRANWPPKPPYSGLWYLEYCQWLSTDLSDGALYQHFQGNDAAAIETLRDQWHLADLTVDETNKRLTGMLVSIGIRKQCLNQLEMIASDVRLTKDAGNDHDLQVAVAHDFIDQLLNYPDPAATANEFATAERSHRNDLTKPMLDPIIRTVKRNNMERGLAAMSLACHLYKFDNGDWPKSIGDLRAYLPHLPIDSFGVDKQTLGYVLIEGGLPDGSDRPLVYSISEAKDGLFFRIDQPAYGFYVLDNNDGPHKNGGQFRDVTSWTPTTASETPATQPLP